MMEDYKSPKEVKSLIKKSEDKLIRRRKQQREERVLRIRKEQEDHESLRLQSYKEDQEAVAAHIFPDVKIVNPIKRSVGSSSSRTATAVAAIGSMLVSNVFYNAGDNSKYVIESYNAEDQRFKIQGPGMTSSNHLTNMRMDDSQVKISTKWKDDFQRESNTRSTLVWQKSKEPTKKRIWWCEQAHQEYSTKTKDGWKPVWTNGNQFPLTWTQDGKDKMVWNLENIDDMCGLGSTDSTSTTQRSSVSSPDRDSEQSSNIEKSTSASANVSNSNKISQQQFSSYSSVGSDPKLKDLLKVHFSGNELHIQYWFKL